jgi:hypothetical protein
VKESVQDDWKRGEDVSEQSIVFIGWDGFDQRNEGYCRILGARSLYIGKHHSNRFAAFLSWLGKAYRSWRALKEIKPDIVIIKNTHWIIAATLLIIRSRLAFRLVLDSHSSAFDGGLVYPSFLHQQFVRKADLSLVTNDADRDQVVAWGGRVTVIPFPPVDYGAEIMETYPLSDGFNICFAHTYANDEPYDIVMEAVERVSDVHLYVTGNPEKSTHPLWDSPRVVHTGFLSRSQYLGLLTGCDAVMTLTTRDNTMQKAGNEAVFLGRPLITSDLNFLRQYFNKGTIHVSLTADSIEAGIRDMKKQRLELTKEMKQFAIDLKKINWARVLAIPSQVMNGEEGE